MTGAGASLATDMNQNRQRLGGPLSTTWAGTKGFGRGLGTGGKAVVNGLSQAGATTISLGSWEVEGPWAVNDFDRSVGYDTASSFARASGEILIGVATGGTAAAWSQGGRAARVGSYAIRGLDTASNVAEMGRGGVSIYNDGLTWQNALQVAGAGLGTAGDYADLMPTRGFRAPSKSLSPHLGGSGNVTRQSISDGLTGYTQQGNRVARGIGSGDIRMNVLGDELFEKAYRLKGGTGTAPQAFAYGNQTYMRRGSSSLLSDTLHEGTHAIDFRRGVSGSTHQFEKRAYFYERQYQRASGGQVDFPAINDMLDHIYQNY